MLKTIVEQLEGLHRRHRVGYTMLLITKDESSLPVFPSYACTVHTMQASKLRAT
jgi:hypothetical protein